MATQEVLPVVRDAGSYRKAKQEMATILANEHGITVKDTVRARIVRFFDRNPRVVRLLRSNEPVSHAIAEYYRGRRRRTGVEETRKRKGIKIPAQVVYNFNWSDGEAVSLALPTAYTLEQFNNDTGWIRGEATHTRISGKRFFGLGPRVTFQLDQTKQDYALSFGYDAKTVGLKPIVEPAIDKKGYLTVVHEVKVRRGK